MVKSLEAGKLIVGAIAVCTDPTGTAAIALGCDAALQTKAWFSKKPTLAALASDLDKQFNQRLAEQRFDKPADARALLPQMLERVVLSGEQIVECDLDPSLLLHNMQARLKNDLAEFNTLEIISAFEALTLPLLTEACNDTRLEQALRPHLTRALLSGNRELLDGQATAREMDERYHQELKGMMEQVLAGQIASLTLDDLKTLASQFGNHSIIDIDGLKNFISNKAEEYTTYRETIDALDDRVAAIANLKGAALHAADTLNFDEVELLLSRVDEVETEIAADTKVARARNALMRGKEQQAYHILSAAADSFASIDPLEPARRRILTYFSILRDHGLRYGGAGLPLSQSLLGPVLSGNLRQADPWLWAAGKNSLAVTLQEQGIHTDGPQGANFLAQAVTAYRSALEVRTRAGHPVHWAMTQNNLGNALSEQGTRTDGPQGADLLAQAVTAYREALEVRTRAEHPVDWAMTQNNLGNALSEQGTRTDGPQGADLLAQAVTAFRAALKVRTRAEHPVNWAMTQNNLAIALQEQGTRTDGPQGADLLAQAVTAYRAALEVTTRAEHPVDWAMTQNNLACALGDQGIRTDGPQGADLLAQAVTAYRTALEVRTRAEHPVAWARTQENIAIALLNRANHDTTQDPRPDLTEARTAVTNALDVYDPVHMSYDHGTATRLRDHIQTALDAL